MESRTELPIAARRSASHADLRTSRASRILDGWPFWFFVGVVTVQSVHMFEHVLQLIQVTVWHVPGRRGAWPPRLRLPAAGHRGVAASVLQRRPSLFAVDSARTDPSCEPIHRPEMGVSRLRHRGARLGDMARGRACRDHLQGVDQPRVSLPRDRRRRSWTDGHRAALRIQRGGHLGHPGAVLVRPSKANGRDRAPLESGARHYVGRSP